MKKHLGTVSKKKNTDRLKLVLGTNLTLSSDVDQEKNVCLELGRGLLGDATYQISRF